MNWKLLYSWLLTNQVKWLFTIHCVSCLLKPQKMWDDFSLKTPLCLQFLIQQTSTNQTNHGSPTVALPWCVRCKTIAWPEWTSILNKFWIFIKLVRSVVSFQRRQCDNKDEDDDPTTINQYQPPQHSSHQYYQYDKTEPPSPLLPYHHHFNSTNRQWLPPPSPPQHNLLCTCSLLCSTICRKIQHIMKTL